MKGLINEAFKTAHFANGFRVIYREVPRSITHCGLVVNAGSRDELPNESGAAHFIEHTLFKGTKRRKMFHILNRLDSVGGEVNAYTSKEDTWVYAAFLESHLERAIELLADIAFSATFPEKEVAKERDVITDEIQSYLDNPADAIFDDFEERIFAGNGLGTNILGEELAVQSMERQTLVDFVDRHYKTDEMVFSAVGSTPWKKVLRLCEKYFGDQSAGKAQLLRVTPGKNPVFDIREEREIHQVHHVMGMQTVGADHTDRLGLAVLANYLGGPTMNNRLSLQVREKHGLAYNIEASYSPYSDAGLFSIYFGTDRKQHARAERLVKQELRRMCKMRLGVRQMHEIKRQIIGHIAIAQDSGNAIMTGLGKSFLLYNRVENLEAVLKAVEAVTADDVLRLANEVLHPDLLSHCVYMPGKG
jgi:predicted Zn-dependent peptidase